MVYIIMYEFSVLAVFVLEITFMLFVGLLNMKKAGEK